MQLVVKIISIINCLWLLKFPFCQFESLKKMCVLEVKLWANRKRGRLHFWMRESSNGVYREKENFYFPIVPHTFLRLGGLAPKFRQACTITQNNWFLEVLNVIFGFLVQKTLPIQIFKVLVYSILCTKNVIF